MSGQCTKPGCSRLPAFKSDRCEAHQREVVTDSEVPQGNQDGRATLKAQNCNQANTNQAGTLSAEQTKGTI